MAYTYVTFGQTHVHSINGKTLDRNCVARINASSALDGRKKAFSLFKEKFAFEYYDNEWLDREEERMSFYPHGYVDITVGDLDE